MERPRQGISAADFGFPCWIRVVMAIHQRVSELGDLIEDEGHVAGVRARTGILNGFEEPAKRGDSQYSDEETPLETVFGSEEVSDVSSVDPGVTEQDIYTSFQKTG